MEALTSMRDYVGGVALAAITVVLIAAVWAGLVWPLVAIVFGVGIAGLASGRRTANQHRESLRDQTLLLERQHRALELAGIGSWHWDLTTARVVYDSRCSTMLGYADGEIESALSAWGKLVHPDDLGAARRAMDDLLEGRAARYEARVRLRDADGAWRVVLDRGRVTAFGPDGRPTRAQGIHIDVTPAALAPVATSATAGRWVIVDDDDAVRAVLEIAVRRQGLETASFADPQQAWAAISSGGAPLGIITDYDMPTMNGVQLAERVRLGGMNCPVLMVSGSESPALGECRAIDGLLEKPFTAAALAGWLAAHAAGAVSRSS